MQKVLIIEPIAAAGLEVLGRRTDVAYEIVTGVVGERLKDAVADADGIIVRRATLGAEVIDAAARLRIVSRHGVGYETIDVDALTRRGIPLTLVGDANAVAVAEHTIYLMLALARRGLAYDRAVRDGGFDIRESGSTVELWRKTVLVVGFGRIGREVAARCRAFGMEVVVYDPYVPADAAGRSGCKWIDELDGGLAEADFVTLHAPLTDETRHLIGAPELRAMKSTAFLINAARGGIVDQGALNAALASGDIAGAGLDAFADEPPAPDEPLLRRDNVVLSPHAAALTRECADRMAIVCAQNVLAGLDGTLDASLVVNPEVL